MKIYLSRANYLKHGSCSAVDFLFAPPGYSVGSGKAIASSNSQTSFPFWFFKKGDQQLFHLFGRHEKRHQRLSALHGWRRWGPEVLPLGLAMRLRTHAVHVDVAHMRICESRCACKNLDANQPHTEEKWVLKRQQFIILFLHINVE